MAQDNLWAISRHGHVYTLSIKSNEWTSIGNSINLPGIKKVAVGHSSVWAIGCDHQVYLYVPHSEVPTRKKYICYENERWVPGRGWSGDNLFPLDPHQWSNEDGSLFTPKAYFKLPSLNWMWESDWYIDENVSGYLTDKGGWRYSNLDFQHGFSHHKTFKSCVRKRRWVRYCTFAAEDRWTKIDGLHADPMEEPFVDIAVGGFEMLNKSPGFLLVYAVTIHGRLMVKNNVEQIFPEGESWHEIMLPEGCDAQSVSISSAGLMWVITFQGLLLVRLGICSNTPHGSDWCILPPPDIHDKPCHLSIGNHAAWLTTESGHVKVRKGLRVTDMGDQAEAATGTAWLDMVHRMRSVFISQNDQVFGIGFEDREIYFRSGVTEDELTGRQWLLINLPASKPTIEAKAFQRSLSEFSTDESSSMDPDYQLDIQVNESEGYVSEDSKEVVDFTLKQDCTSPTSDVTMKNSVSSGSLSSTMYARSADNIDKLSDSASCDNISFRSLSKQQDVIDSSKKEIQSKLSAFKSITPNSVVYKLKEIKNNPKSLQADILTLSKETVEFGNSIKKLSTATIDTLMKGSQAEQTSRVSASGTRYDSTRQNHGDDLSLNSLTLDENPDSILPASGYESLRIEDGHILWTWLSASGCNIHSSNDISLWLNPGSSNGTQAAPKHRFDLYCGDWRTGILSDVKCLNDRIRRTYGHYTLAIKPSTWSKQATVRWWQDIGWTHKWTDCMVELTQDEDVNKNGQITFQYKHRNHMTFLQTALDDVIAVQSITDISSPAPLMAMHISTRLDLKLRQLPIKLKFSTDQDLEDWLAVITVACCEQRRLASIPHHASLWSTTIYGQVLLHQPDDKGIEEDPRKMFWQQQGGNLNKIETSPSKVIWGIGLDGKAWVHTGGYGGSFFKGMATSPQGIHPQTDTHIVYLYENQRWRPVVGFTDKVMLSGTPAWTDDSGKKECTKQNTGLPLPHSAWVSDWLVDVNPPGGADANGWQYSRDFSHYKQKPFRAKPKLRSYVRRRRWMRFYQIQTTGPWQEVKPLKIKDISIQMDPDVGSKQLIGVWAIGQTGEVLCRLGVSMSKPSGDSWLHVAHDVACTSVSIGGDLRVWATAEDGSAWYRAGITSSEPTGSCWYHIPPPPNGNKLKQVAAGMSLVCAIDTQGKLWLRAGIQDRSPEGEKWILICENVHQISIGPKNQLFAILNRVQCYDGFIDGVLAVWQSPDGTVPHKGKWLYGIGGGWNHISARSWLK